MTDGFDNVTGEALARQLYDQGDRRYGSIGSVRSLEWEAADFIVYSAAEIKVLRAGQAASAARIKALEEAMECIDDLFGDAVQFDCERGVRSLSEVAYARYLIDAPETKAAIHKSLEIIRALLKEADQ